MQWNLKKKKKKRKEKKRKKKHVLTCMYLSFKEHFRYNLPIVISQKQFEKRPPHQFLHQKIFPLSPSSKQEGLYWQLLAADRGFSLG